MTHHTHSSVAVPATRRAARPVQSGTHALNRRGQLERTTTSSVRQAAGARPLGINTKKCSADELRIGRRRERLAARRFLWKHSKRPRGTRCGRRITHNALGIEVRTSEGVAHFTNVQHCGSVWACPTCSPRIRQERASDIDAGLTRWLELYGPGTVMLLTPTIPHDFGESCSALMDTVKHAWRAMLSGEAWMTDKATFSVGHWIRSWDATHGAHGWHPHKHIVLFSERALSDDERERLKARLYYRYNAAIMERGYRAVSYEHGFDLDVARTREQLAEYMMKVVFGEDWSVAMECARGDLKRGRQGGRSVWQVLGDAVNGDARSLRIFNEWETATRGRQFIRWSNGLKKLLGVTTRSDDEIVEEQIGGETVYTFAPDDWHAVCAAPRGQTTVLELAEGPDPGARIAQYVRRCRIRWQEERRSKHLRIGAMLYG